MASRISIVTNNDFHLDVLPLTTKKALSLCKDFLFLSEYWYLAGGTAMKVIAISQRGKKRDFFDMYWYCKNREPLAEVVRRALKQYPQNLDLAHICKSFAYFEDAENDPMPQIFFKASWNEVKKYFRAEAARLARELIYLK